MERRFGFKDLLIVLLLAAILVSIWIAMKQFDRQWRTVKGNEQQIKELAQNVSALSKEVRKLLAEGVVVQSPSDVDTNTTVSTTEDKDPFYRQRGATKQADFAPGDWMIDAFAQTVAKITPLISVDTYGSAIQSYVLDTLIVRDPDTLEWQPWIANRWSVSEDGLTIAFNLREGVRFSDGKELTSADVVFTYELIMNPDINCPRLRPYYETIASVEADGPYRVVFRMRETYFQSLGVTGGMDIMAKHYYEQFTAEEFNELPGLLFGSGPYKLDGDPKEWKSGSGKIVLVRNDNYWGLAPAFDRVIYREITDETARLVSFRNGEIDRYGVPADQYERLKDDEGLNERGSRLIYEVITGGYRYVGWNQQRKGEPTPFADRRVRQAMSLLLDRQAMCDQLQKGLATPTSGPFHRLGTQANPDVKAWPYDVAGGKELLTEAGFADRDGDGVIENALGTPFRFKLIYPASSNEYKQMALFMRDAYAEAGIVLEPDALEWTIMLQRMDERNFDAITLGWSGSIESDPKQIFHSTSIAEGGDNYVNYVNTELDQLIDTARMTMDKAKRLELWHNVHRILHEDEPYTFLFTRKSVIFIDKRFGNLQITRVGLNRNAEWYTPLPLQRWSQ